jgi:U3 small nucleolar RNA-associated protein 20
MKALATELQDLVQSKVGVTKFSHTYNRIRQSVLGVQRERKAVRVLQVTLSMPQPTKVSLHVCAQAKTNPKAAAKRKLQRNVIKKDSRKRKNSAFA